MADRRPLRIRRLGPSIRRVRNAGPKAPALSADAGHVDPFSMLGDLSRAGCGGGPPRIAYSQTGTSNRRYSPPGASEIRTVNTSTITAKIRLVLGDTSRVGCALGLTRRVGCAPGPPKGEVHPRALQYRRGGFVRSARVSEHNIGVKLSGNDT